MVFARGLVFIAALVFAGCSGSSEGPGGGSTPPGGAVECEPVTCELYCENGFAKDDRGCEVCACAGEGAVVVPPDDNPCYVGGCSSTLCSEDENAASTCEWLPEYACYRDATCERQADGGCGWTQTAELSECLRNPPPE